MKRTEWINKKPKPDPYADTWHGFRDGQQVRRLSDKNTYIVVRKGDKWHMVRDLILVPECDVTRDTVLEQWELIDKLPE